MQLAVTMLKDSNSLLAQQKQQLPFIAETTDRSRCLQPSEMLWGCRDTKVTESSESVLAGTKRPPFRLYCNAVVPPGANIRVRPAVSEEFVVSCLNTTLSSYSGLICSPQWGIHTFSLMSWLSLCMLSCSQIRH